MNTQLYAVMKTDLTLAQKVRLWFFLRAIRTGRVKINVIDL
jgi:hypothetical protein